MKLLAWLKRKFAGGALPPATPTQDEQWQRKCAEIAVFLNDLARKLGLDTGTSAYFAQFIARNLRAIAYGRPTSFGPDTTIDDLALEAARQGFIDPLAQGADKGTVLRDDLLMRVLLRYAEKDSRAALGIVRNFAEGRLKKRSRVRGTEEALRMAKEFVARSRTHRGG